MFSDDLMGRGTPILRRVILMVCLNVVTHVTIDFRSGTGSLGATLKRFRKARWVAITYSRFEKKASTANARSSLLQRMITTDCNHGLLKINKQLVKYIHPIFIPVGSRMVSESAALEGHAGKPLEMNCEATGDPPLEMTWSRDGLPLGGKRSDCR